MTNDITELDDAGAVFQPAASVESGAPKTDNGAPRQSVVVPVTHENSEGPDGNIPGPQPAYVNNVRLNESKASAAASARAERGPDSDAFKVTDYDKYDTVEPPKTDATSTKEKETETETESTIPYMSGYEDIIPYLEQKIKESQPKSKEELEREARRQRTEGIISGIADAVQSVSNLVYTTKYAPNMYNAKEGMTAKARERFDKAKADREAAEDRWYRYALTLGRIKGDAAQGERTWKHTIEREKVADKRADAAEVRAQAKADRDGRAAFEIDARENR